MKDPRVLVTARRPYEVGARHYGRGDQFFVGVLEALRLATRGIVSLSKRTTARRASPPPAPAVRRSRPGRPAKGAA